MVSKESIKRIYPCVKCTRKEFEEQIEPELLKYGYKVIDISENFDYYNIIVTNFNNVPDEVSNVETTKHYNRYLCHDIREFLAATKSLAKNGGWFEEKEQNTEHEGKWPCVKCTVEEFDKKIAPELGKYEFDLRDVDTEIFDRCNLIVTNHNGRRGCVANLVSTRSDCDSRYLCPDIDTFLHDCQEVATREGWFKSKPDDPTLTEARKQFRELTKLYTVEQLSASDKPRSWEEYLEQNPAEDTTELDEKIDALRKLILIRNKWIGDWRFTSPMGHGGIFYIYKNRKSILSFPTEKMANQFLKTHRELIIKAGDLI